ncbi:PP2C family protein-serine/threonine phosphatase [Thermus filiformis]|uniref:PP2C family protein-serine/threonine phosphatase n=1 Tax=Thermus filiformis TaxID=276 RepID=UPI0014705EFD|nr:PP2C family serine/threonine-protein phosphatase [Thermus filiformis]
MEVVLAALTHPGRKRPKNEDWVAVERTETGAFLLVADGMGGHKTGDVAARVASETILAHVRDKAPSPQVLLEAFEKANRRVYELAQRPEYRGMGTTATALWLDLPYALIAHVGDSRAYLLRQGELLQLTEDHSWVAERMRQGLLTAEEARTHRWRNVITNALGSFPEARVDLLGLKAEPNDLFLLATDGLYSVLEDKTLQEVLKDFPPEEAARRLVDLANEWGGPDNISLAIAKLPEALPQQSRPYALALETARGPVRLKLGDTEEMPTQVLEPKRKAHFSWRDLLLIGAWVVLLLYILLNQR